VQVFGLHRSVIEDSILVGWDAVSLGKGNWLGWVGLGWVALCSEGMCHLHLKGFNVEEEKLKWVKEQRDVQHL